MKELSIEEKAEAYDRAIEGIQEILSSGEDSIKMSRLQLRLQGIFPELKESKDEKISKEIIYFLSRNTFQFGEEIDKYKSWVAWLEKQGEKNPADNLESKFKVGDWIVINGLVLRIMEVRDDLYETRCQNGEVRIFDTYIIDKDAHLWTIADAKDGDVLSDGTTIFIFKDLLSDGSVMSYCDYDTDSGESDAFCPLSMNLVCSKITPSTKEQRDTLRKAMADSGYVFDFERKELKKTENESENYKQQVMSEMADLAKDYIRQKHTWSEEDEKNLTKCLETLIAQTESVDLENINKEWRPAIDWLKSLKERIG